MGIHSLDELRVFVQVVESGGITAAGLLADARSIYEKVEFW